VAALDAARVAAGVELLVGHALAERLEDLGRVDDAVGLGEVDGVRRQRVVHVAQPVLHRVRDDASCPQLAHLHGHAGAEEPAELVTEAEDALHLGDAVGLCVDGKIQHELPVGEGAGGGGVVLGDGAAEIGLLDERAPEPVELDPGAVVVIGGGALREGGGREGERRDEGENA